MHREEIIKNNENHIFVFGRRSVLSSFGNAVNILDAADGLRPKM